MKRSLWIFAALLFLYAGKLQAQALASFSFSLNSEAASHNWFDQGWTNVYGDPYTGVRTATANGITISSIRLLNWSTATNSCAADLQGDTIGTFFPVHILRCYWYQAGTASAFNQAVPQLQLSGLNKDSFYIIRMSTSSFFNVGDPMLYTVSGRTVYPGQTINAYNNAATGVTFQHIYPDSSGKINVYINTTTGTFAALSGLQVIPGSSTVGVPVVAITSPDNNDVLAEEGSVTINATATEIGSTISKVEFYVDTTKVGQSTTAPYQFTWANPEAGLHTLTAKATDASGASSSSVINVSIESLSSFWSMTGNIHANADSNFLGTVDTNRLAFRTNNIERMSIFGDGTVGIGTTRSNGYKLAVKGTALFTRVQVVSLANWPDYVFRKEYRLRKLGDLASYIDKYHHLPEIISAAKVGKEGFDLGANQAAVLKKVEELTLYLIDENRRLSSQSTQLEGQSKKIATLETQLAEQNALFQQQQREIDELKALIKKK